MKNDDVPIEDWKELAIDLQSDSQETSKLLNEVLIILMEVHPLVEGEIRGYNDIPRLIRELVSAYQLLLQLCYER